MSQFKIRSERPEMVSCLDKFASSSLDKFVITVRGEAILYLPAERALLNIEVSSDGEDKQQVARDVVNTAKILETLLRQLGPKDTTAEAKKAAAIDVWGRTSLVESSEDPST